MTKKPVKKSTSLLSVPDFSEFDRVFENFRRDMEKSFFSFPRLNLPSLPKLQETSCDVVDEGKQFKVSIDMPGVKKNEIIINVTENALEVHAEHKEESESKKKNYLRKERSEAYYDRIIPLHEKILPAKVKSKLVDGVLEVLLPKSKPTSVKKKHSVKVQ